MVKNTSAHVIAMTGSYFRGDAIPVLEPADEARFRKVTYNYYEQLDGYTHLKSLGIGYHFYQGRYTDAIGEILDTDKKTILHIPNVQSGESTKDKHREVDEIIDAFGTVEPARTSMVSCTCAARATGRSSRSRISSTTSRASARRSSSTSAR